MQCAQADYSHFENGAHGSGSTLWTFKLEFGIVHTTNCSVCRSYMTHVAVANHSGDASFKDALNHRENRVSTAFLDGLQGGRQMQQEHDSPVVSRYRDERDKALQDLNAAKKEMAIFRDKVLALELAAQNPVTESVSKRRDEAIGSSTESPAKSDMSSVERLLLSPSEDLDALSTLSTLDDHDSLLIPHLPTAVEDREALQTETPRSAKPLASIPASIGPLRETTVPTENVPQSPALLFEAPSSETPEPAKPSSQPSTCAFSLSNPSPSDQHSPSVKSWAPLLKTSSATLKSPELSPQLSTCSSNASTSYRQSSSVEPPGDTNVSTANLANASSTIPKFEEPSPRPSAHALNSSNPSTSDQQSSSVEPLREVGVSTANLAKVSSSAIPKSEKPSLRPSTYALSSSSSSTSDQQSPSIEPPGETSISTANVPKSQAQLAEASSATTKPKKPSPRPSTCTVSSSNPPTLSQQSSSTEPPGETNVSTTDLANVSSSATPKSAKLSPRPSTCALSSSNLSTSDQQSSSVEPLGETNVSTAKVPSSRAQLAKASSSVTPKPEKPSPRPSTRALSSSNPPTSDQQSSSVEPPGETNVSTVKVPKSWAQVAEASSAIPKPEKPSLRPSTCSLSLSNPSSDRQSSSVLTTNPSPRPLTTIAHLEALMKAACSGDDSSLTRIKAFCGTARSTPRKQRTELQRYALLHWRKPSPPLSSSVTSSELGTVHTTVGDGTFSTEIHVDSSAWGIGFVMDGLWLAWKFSASLALSGNSIDNNWAEMLAVEVGLWTVIHWVRSVIQKKGDVIKSLEIIVCSDNAGVVKAIEKRHSNFSPQQDILLRILDMVSKYDIQLSMKWIASGDNLADGPSRGVPGRAPDLLPSIPPLPSYLSDTLVSS